MYCSKRRTYVHRSKLTARALNPEVPSTLNARASPPIVASLGPYSRTMPRAPWWSYGVVLFLMRKEERRRKREGGIERGGGRKRGRDRERERDEARERERER